MSNNFLKLLKPTANLTHNGFDLSQKHVFSSKVGQLVPCLAVETVPGDKFRIDLGGLMRSQTFNTAAFIRCRFSYDFFFVPYSQLWHPFNQFITQREDKHSTRQLYHECTPTIELRVILYFIALECQSWNDEHSFMQNIHGKPVFEDAVRLLDMLGYGDFRWIVTDIVEHSQTFETLQQALDEFAGQYVNLFRLAAYQHVFYDFYRNKYYDTDTTGGIEPTTYSNYRRDYLQYFNFDDISCNAFAFSHFLEYGDIYTQDHDSNLANPNYRRLAGLLTLRFAQWKHDLFTSVLPSQQFGAVSAVDVAAVGALKFDTDGQSLGPLGSAYRYQPIDVPSIPNAAGIGTTNSTSVPLLDGSWSIPSKFDVLQLRKAESLQAWKQNTLRAGNQVNDAFKAHFGVESYYEADNEVKYLGSFDSKLDVREISSTSNTGVGSNGSLGDLAAQGVSVVQGNAIEFNPSDFGVIICVSQIVPDVDYKPYMLDKANRLYEPFDFFTPEFQNIGLEAVSVVDYDNSQGASIANDVLGFAPRYWMYKNSIDKVHGEFADGTLSPWVAPRVQNVSNISSVPLRNFYVTPNIYDSVFGVIADASQQSDQFLHDVFFDIKAIRPMSELGLPQF